MTRAGGESRSGAARRSVRRNILLVVEYDGRAFAGFQAQRQGASQPTVQETLEAAIARTSGEEPRLVAAGRTDRGVHALGQVVNFLTDARIPPERWAAALNSRLPPTVRVWQSREVPTRFHARYDARSKLYRYQLSWGTPFTPPLQVGRVWAIRATLNVAAMALAASFFVGRPYLRAFCAAGGQPVRDWRRRISRCQFLLEPETPCPGMPTGEGEGETVRWAERVGLNPDHRAGQSGSLWVEAEGFLYHQVRTMMGTLVEVGLGKRSAESVQALLSDPEAGRERAGPTAPADGLYLVGVRYPAAALGQDGQERQRADGGGLLADRG